MQFARFLQLRIGLRLQVGNLYTHNLCKRHKPTVNRWYSGFVVKKSDVLLHNSHNRNGPRIIGFGKRSMCTKTSIDLKDKYPLQYQYLETCQGVYASVNNAVSQELSENENSRVSEYWSSSKYVGVSANLMVSYIDTANTTEDLKKPVIILVHGAPGSHVGFLSLVDKLEPHARVIVPNFPGYGFTDMDDEGYFQHSIPEKVELIVDLLGALKIKRVAMAIGHSIGSFPVLLFAAARVPALPVESAFFMNPTGHIPWRAARPLPALRLSDRMWERRWLRFLIRPFLKFTIRRLGMDSSDEHMMVCARTVVNTPFGQLAPLMSRLDLMRFPLGVVYGSRDPLVEANISHEVGRLLGVEEWEEVERRGDTPLEGGAELLEGQRYIRGLRIAGGSHFCFKDQLDNVTSMILDLLVHTSKSAAKAARS